MKLSEVLFYEQPIKYIVESDLYNDAHEVPVLTAGKSFLLGYTNEKSGIYENLPCIIFDDFTTAIKYVDFPFKVKSSAMKILTTNDKNDLRYLYHFLSTIKLDTELHKRYWISRYAELDVDLPSLPEQQRIAAELDAVCSVLAKQKKQYKLLGELVKSKFNEMFGCPVANERCWDVKTGHELFVFTSGKFNPISNLSDNYDYLCYGGNGVTGKSKDYLVDLPTIVIGRVGAYCGSVHKTNNKIWVTDNAIYIKNFKTQDFDVMFLYELFLQQNLNKFANYSGQPKITQQPLQSLNYIIPPIELQTQFAAFVTHTEQSKATLKSQMQQTETLYKGLMQKYFESEGGQE